MKKIVHWLIFATCFFFMTHIAVSQESLKKIMQNKQVVAEKTFEVPIKKVFSSNNAIAILNRPDTGAKGSVILFNNNGDELWQKEFRYVDQISLGRNSDRIIIAHEWRIGDSELYTCLNFSGNKLWEVRTIDAGLTQSSNGKYAITTRVSGDEWKGKFQIFSMETGEEIPVLIKKNYRWFSAQFLNNNEVALLLQKEKLTRDWKVLKEYDRLKEEKRIEEARELMRKTRKGFIVEYEALELLIYNITTSSIVKVTELTSIIGDIIRSDPDDCPIALRVSENGKFISVYAEGTNDKPYVLILDGTGNHKYTFEGFKYVRDIAFFDSIYLAIMDGPTIQLYDLQMGLKLWTQKTDKYADVFQMISVESDQLMIQTHHISTYSISNLFNFNIQTGEILDTPKTDIIIAQSTKYSLVVIDKKNNKIIFTK